MVTIKQNDLHMLSGRTINLGEFIDAVKHQLSNSTEESKIFIPMYQRNYKWNRKMAVKLIKDLIKAFKSSTSKSIALFTLYIDDKDNIEIVDGQQRMITLLLLFKALDMQASFLDLEFVRDFHIVNLLHKRSFFIKVLNEKGFVTHSLENNVAKSDKRRLAYNYLAIKEEIQNVILDGNEKDSFVTFLRENVQLLLNVTSDTPISEFLNLNCNKTRFSVGDRIRADLMIFNALNFSRLSDDEKDILDRILEESDYKLAVSRLFEQLIELLYVDEVYNTIQLGYKNPDKTKENRINTMFSRYLTNDSIGYTGFKIPAKKYQINLLKQMMVYKNVLNELIQNLQADYQVTQKAYKTLYRYKPNTRFFELVNKYVDKANTNNLFAEILHLECSIDKIIFDYIKQNVRGSEVYFFNSYFDALSNNEPDIQDTSFLKEQFENIKHRSNHYFPMDKMVFEDTIQGSGKYIINRYVSKQTKENDKLLSLNPVNKFNDKSIKVADKNKELIGKNILIRELLCDATREIVIPAIQRDYCMGNHFGLPDKSDLLSYLIKEFESDREKDIILSAITIFEQGNNRILIYDGQQRIFTLASIVRILDKEKIDNKTILCNFEFEYREKMNNFCKEFFSKEFKEYRGSSYAENAIINLDKELHSNLKKEDYQDFKNFLLDKVSVDVITVDTSLSEAEQFFIDINGGVQLVPYEIFKCKINEKSQEVFDLELEIQHENNWINLIDNEWLDFFYKFNNTKINDENAIEELVEMRFIEFCCRMIYWEKYIRLDKTDQHPLKLKGFKQSENTKDLEDCDKFINDLTSDDFRRIIGIMNALLSSFEKVEDEKEIVEYRGVVEKLEGIGYCIPYFNIETNVSKVSCLNRFIKGLVCEANNQGSYQEERATDLIIWAILNDLQEPSDESEKIIKKWNSSIIPCLPYVYITPTFIGQYKQTILPIPSYYFDNKNYLNIFHRTLEKEINVQNQLTILYDNIMRDYLKLENKEVLPLINNESGTGGWNLYYNYRRNKFTKYNSLVIKGNYEIIQKYYISKNKNVDLFEINFETSTGHILFEPNDRENFLKV
ncbi:DUF262 domain-containing protein [Lysinibacillus sp. NPDC097287]|uniref:GmrSD restriction endonuclease domain-containing protein n=1 Tax=Lysinibacillus sp. NPDC097287 TaxID=3364144 RepID=UPI0037FACF66